MPFISTSTGTVIRRSTSSEACPCHCVMISTRGGGGPDRHRPAAGGTNRRRPRSRTWTQEPRERWRSAVAAMRWMIDAEGTSPDSASRSVPVPVPVPFRSRRRLGVLQEEAAFDYDGFAGLQTVGDLLLVAAAGADLDAAARKGSARLGHEHVGQFSSSRSTAETGVSSPTVGCRMKSHLHVEIALQHLAGLGTAKRTAMARVFGRRRRRCIPPYRGVQELRKQS